MILVYDLGSRMLVHSTVQWSSSIKRPIDMYTLSGAQGYYVGWKKRKQMQKIINYSFTEKVFLNDKK
jgi:hypothetical protein